MIISRFSKDGKSGFSAGTNRFTPDRAAAAAVTAFSALVIMLVGGVFRLFAKPSKKDKKNEKTRKKKPFWLIALPIIYKQVQKRVKTAETSELLSGLVREYSGGEGEEEEAEDEAAESGIEVVEAIPIDSEDEVYEYV